ncbi:hypothetical protein PG997_013276 [Apiospora hydei]|uniref:Secreted protein n=1 Tax=Apiospora hydei TaxID=1337664 RepID=A0ABR1V8Z0_9PEZI
MKFHNIALPLFVVALGAVMTFHQDQEITFTNHVYRSVLHFNGAKSSCQLSMSYDGTTAENIPEFSSDQPAPIAEKRDTVVVVCSIFKTELNESLALRAINVHGC